MQQASIKQAFWDYDFTDQQLLKKLAEGTQREKVWIIGRMLENLPFNSIWKYTTPAQVKDLLPHLHLRPKLKRIWKYTLSLWGKYEKPSY